MYIMDLESFQSCFHWETIFRKRNDHLFWKYCNLTEDNRWIENNNVELISYKELKGTKYYGNDVGLYQKK